LPSLKHKKEVKYMLVKAKNWIMARVKERTSLDGALLVAVGGSILLFGGLAKLLAWAAVLWGAYTLLKAEA
jgi:hypothetical protein